MISLKLQVFILKEFENNWTVGDFFLQTSSITFICSTDVIARESMVKEEAGVNPQDQASNNIQTVELGSQQCIAQCAFYIPLQTFWGLKVKST